ncbi:DUF3558 family protein [Amycolatopsis rhizosphaerae]|nr:DUF3558 family protein [Amycolatopsis rhizosphaerae]
MTACTSTQTGQALPSSSRPTIPSSATSSTNSASSGLTGINACTLLADSEAKQVMAGTARHQDLGQQGGAGTSACSWTTPATNGSASHTFGVTVRPVQRLSDIVVESGAQLSKITTTAGREAAVVKNAGGPGSCLASIAVGSGRVDIIDVVMGAGASTDGACAVVSKVSDYVEPRLPKS